MYSAEGGVRGTQAACVTGTTPPVPPPDYPAMTCEELLSCYYRDDHDEDAFAALRDKAQRLLAWQVRMFCHGRLSPAEVEDVTQEVWLRVVRSRGTGAAWRQDARVATWLEMIARHICIERSRRHSEVPVDPDLELATEAESEPDGPEDPESVVSRLALADCLGRLGRQDRDLLFLRYWENRSHADIGARYGWSISNARNKVMDAESRLRRLLTA